MNAEAAYQVLTHYQLIEGSNDLEGVFTVQQRYETYKRKVIGSLPARVQEILSACESIENEITTRAHGLMDNLSGLSPKNATLVQNMDHTIVAQAGKPLSPSDIDTNPHLNVVYEKHHAVHVNEKIRSLEREMGLKPGQRSFDFRHGYLEPKWKLRQMRLRALGRIYLYEQGLED